MIACVAQASCCGAEQILDACRRALPEVAVPSRVVYLSELPRGATGKLDRNGLAELLQKGGWP